MNNLQRNKLLAQELRALAEMIEYEQSRVVASVTIEPGNNHFVACCETYTPHGHESFYNGCNWWEQYALDDCLRVRVRGEA